MKSIISINHPERPIIEQAFLPVLKYGLDNLLHNSVDNRNDILRIEDIICHIRDRLKSERLINDIQYFIRVIKREQWCFTVQIFYQEISLSGEQMPVGIYVYSFEE